MGQKGKGVAAVAAEKVIEPKVEHKNIFEALAAFQAENPTIERTKEFGKEGDKMHWFYAPLDEILKTVRPLTSKHGLAFTWEEKASGEMVCALYHETYKHTDSKISEVVSQKPGQEEVALETRSYKDNEENVIRSMPIAVRRKGDMKEIGSDSTYARRYTLAEVLGIAPDEDNDFQFTNERREQAESAMYERVKKGIMTAKKVTELDASDKVLRQNLNDIEAGKVPNLGLSEAQLVELAILVENRRKELGFKPEEAPHVPGENESHPDIQTEVPPAPEAPKSTGAVPKL